MMTSFFARRMGSDTGGRSVVLQAGSNLLTGEREVQHAFGSLTSLESDLLLIGASIFAADRASERGDREDIARQIELHIPVVNIARFLPLASNMELILRTLSNDSWRIRFRQDQGEIETTVAVQKVEGKTLLFSGGLDSLAAAIQLSSRGEPLQIISHITRNRQTDQAQRRLVDALRDSGLDLPHHQFFV